MRSTLQLPVGTVSYLDFRPAGAAGTVVLLHGGGVDSAALSWDEVAPRLAAAGYRVIAPDHPGHGQSPLPVGRVTQRSLLDYVGEFVDALGVGRYAIGGLSLGGGLAIGHVLERPEKVTGALLLDSYGLMPRLPGARQPLAWAMQRAGALDAATRWLAANRTMLTWSLKSLIRDPAQRTPELIAEIITAARQPGFTAFEQWQRDEILWNRLRTDYTPRLALFPRPALIIHGEKDTGIPLARARAAATRIPDARLKVVAGAGHWVQRDRPTSSSRRWRPSFAALVNPRIGRSRRVCGGRAESAPTASSRRNPRRECGFDAPAPARASGSARPAWRVRPAWGTARSHYPLSGLSRIGVEASSASGST